MNSSPRVRGVTKSSTSLSWGVWGRTLRGNDLSFVEDIQLTLQRHKYNRKPKCYNSDKAVCFKESALYQAHCLLFIFMGEILIKLTIDGNTCESNSKHCIKSSINFYIGWCLCWESLPSTIIWWCIQTESKPKGQRTRERTISWTFKIIINCKILCNILIKDFINLESSQKNFCEPQTATHI